MHSFIKVLALLGKSACTFVGKCLHSLYIADNDVMGYFSYNVGFWTDLLPISFLHCKLA